MRTQGHLLIMPLLSFGAAADANPPSILNNTDHVVSALTDDLRVLGIPYAQSSGPGGSGPLAVNQTCPSGSGVLALTFATNPTGSGGTLTQRSAWPLKSGNYELEFSDGEKRGAMFFNESTSVTWYPALTGSPMAAASVTNAYCFAARSGAAFLDRSAAIANAATVAEPEYAAGSSHLVMPSVPYQLINQSSSGYTLAAFDQAAYAALETAGIVYSMAYCGTPQTNDYPPVAFVTVLPNYSTNPDRTRGTATSRIDPGSSGCGYQQGIEFSIAWGYAPIKRVTTTSCAVDGNSTFDTCSPSSTTEGMTAILAALKWNHPKWTWGDVKSVLRATASNWRSGYAASNANGPAFGYGNVDYSRANLYAGTIFLQPPGMALQTRGDHAVLTLYPFMSSRRAGEVIYAFQSAPTFPPPATSDEYDYAQVLALARSHGGALVYDSHGAGGVQTYDHVSLTSETVYFVAFTVDDDADLTKSRYSRAEGFSILRAGLMHP
jgi:hypothetical protein